MSCKEGKHRSLDNWGHEVFTRDPVDPITCDCVRARIAALEAAQMIAEGEIETMRSAGVRLLDKIAALESQLAEARREIERMRGALERIGTWSAYRRGSQDLSGDSLGGDAELALANIDDLVRDALAPPVGEK